MRFALLPFLLLSLLPSVHAAPATPPAAAVDSSAVKDRGPPPAFIYLVARLKITGTDLTEAIFFRHNAFTTMEECEAERNAGVTTGWRHLSRYYLKTFKGFSYEVDYRCAGSEKQELAYWRQGVPSDHFYLIETRNSELQVTPHTSFFTCRDSLRKISAKEDIDAFCSLSSQALVERKPG